MRVGHVVANPKYVDALLRDDYAPKGWKLLDVQADPRFASVVMVLGEHESTCSGCGLRVVSTTVSMDGMTRAVWRDEIGLSDNSNWRCPGGADGRQPHFVGERPANWRPRTTPLPGWLGQQLQREAVGDPEQPEEDECLDFVPCRDLTFCHRLPICRSTRRGQEPGGAVSDG